MQTQQQQQAHFLKHLGLKVFSLIAVHTVWHTILAHSVFHQYPCAHCGTLIEDSISAHFVKLHCTVRMYLFTFWDVVKGPTDNKISILCIGFPDGIGCSGAFWHQLILGTYQTTASVPIHCFCQTKKVFKTWHLLFSRISSFLNDHLLDHHKIQ